MSSWFQKTRDVAIENFKMELEEKEAFVKTSYMPEEVGKALFKYGFSLEDLKYMNDEYAVNTDSKTICRELDPVYLEERVIRISSPTFDKTSPGWNPWSTKAQQRLYAIETLGYGLALMENIEEENKSGVISVPPFIVKTLMKNVQEENDITQILTDRLENITKTDDIKYEAIVNKYKDTIVRLTKGYGTDMKHITYALLKNNVSTFLIASLISALDEFEDANVKIAKSLFLTICKISLQN